MARCGRWICSSHALICRSSLPTHMHESAAGIRVVVDARIASGQSGGVEGVIAGLAHGLSRLDGPDEYLFVVWPALADWLVPHVSGPCRLAPDLPVRGHLGKRAVDKATALIDRAFPDRSARGRDA